MMAIQIKGTSVWGFSWRDGPYIGLSILTGEKEEKDEGIRKMTWVPLEDFTL